MNGATWKILVGDCREVLKTLPEKSVHTCVTSPPYLGLRSYGTATWEGGDGECDHTPPPRQPRSERPDVHGFGTRSVLAAQDEGFLARGGSCGRCGAIRVDKEIGREPSPDEYTDAMVHVFREVRRVLRDDGVAWLNLGDSFCSTDKWGGGKSGNSGKHTVDGGDVPSWAVRARKPTMPGIKPKDLVGVPWMIAFALRADGWYLRDAIVGRKTAPMPESIKDRCTQSYEMIFLLTKKPRYYFDAESIREPAVLTAGSGNGYVRDERLKMQNADGTPRGSEKGWNDVGGGRNRRNVWDWAPEPSKIKHYALMPSKIVDPCVLAGCPEKVCAECGKPWMSADGPRALDRSRRQARRALEIAEAAGLTDAHLEAIRAVGITDVGKSQVTQSGFGNNDPVVQGLADEAKEVLGGYYREFTFARPSRGPLVASCSCDAGTMPGTVLDPFAGAATTGLVSLRRGRSFIGIELSPVFAEMGRERLRGDAPMFNVPGEITDDA